MIVFFDEYWGIGGAGNLIFNLTKYIYQNYRQQVKIICTENSFIKHRLTNLKIPFVFIDSNLTDFTGLINKEDIVVRTDFGNMVKFRNLKSKFLYWEIMPTVLANSIVPEKTFFKKKLLTYLQENSAIFFMDKNGPEELERRGYFISNPEYLPIPVEIQKNIKTKDFNKKNNFTITYIGRAVNWKIYPLKKVIDDCSLIDDYNFNFLVFCDNKAIYQHILSSKFSNITIQYFENIYGEEMEKVLQKKSDLHFGMGTSALDAAKFGIPTILLDYSTKEFPVHYQYRFLHHARGYSLGDDLKNWKLSETDNELSNIINILNNKQSLYKLVADLIEYVEQNHSLEIITKLFLNKCNRGDATISNVFRKLSYIYYEGKGRRLIF